MEIKRNNIIQEIKIEQEERNEGGQCERNDDIDIYMK